MPLRHLLVALVAALAVVLGCAEIVEAPRPMAPDGTPVVPARGEVAQDIRDIERRLFEGINEQREQHGLAPLEWRDDLAAVARDYSQLMLDEDFFAHVGPEGDAVDDRVLAAGISFRVVGENLFQSRGLAPDLAAFAVDGWMQSEGHRENILREVFTQTGIGVAREGLTVYATRIFLTPP